MCSFNTSGSLKYMSLLSSIVNHLFLKPSVCCGTEKGEKRSIHRVSKGKYITWAFVLCKTSLQTLQSTSLTSKSCCRKIFYQHKCCRKIKIYYLRTSLLHVTLLDVVSGQLWQQLHKKGAKVNDKECVCTCTICVCVHILTSDWDAPGKATCRQ